MNEGGWPLDLQLFSALETTRPETLAGDEQYWLWNETNSFSMNEVVGFLRFMTIISLSQIPINLGLFEAEPPIHRL